MKVLIVGGGGREHALAWKVAQSPDVECVYVAPGNAGTAAEAQMENVAIAAADSHRLLDFARNKQIGLTIIGPEAPLVAGIADAFSHAGLPCFGPGKHAAQLEGSKSFCKDFLKRHKIPTAAYQSFAAADEALAYIQHTAAPIVIKADGLAAGKGVVVAQSEQEAISTVQEMLPSHTSAAAGRRIVIEEFLSGEEASFIVMSDGRHILPLASAQDHKTRDAGDTGPNTGGMGAYSPAPIVTPAMHERIMTELIEPTIRGMRKDGHPYTGFLYAGVMISNSGQPKVLEYNCRLGDPETQAIMLRLQSDLVSLCRMAVTGQLKGASAEWDKRAALGVVLASAGYPLATDKGDVIKGLDSRFAEDVKVFHGGTARQDEHIVTAGGRILCVTALGKDVTTARQKAYAATDKIHWSGMFYRKDIGHRAVAREKQALKS